MEFVQPHPNFDMAAFYEDFYTRGFYAFDGSSFLKDFDIDQYNGIASIASPIISQGADNHRGTPEQLAPFDALGKLLSDKYLKDLEHKLIFAHFWSVVLGETFEWHIDGESTDRMPIMATVNCYFDDSDESTGGLLQFHPNQDFPIAEDSPHICAIYPKKYMVVLLNQTPQFKHRISKPTNPLRRIIAYALPQQ